MSVFEELNRINISSKVEKKNKLSYLSWAWAWGELKTRYPLANSKVYEREDGRNYFDDGRTAWVKVSVTICDETGNELEHIEYLPVMNYNNQSIPIDKLTSFDVNKSIQRAITKAIARHGLGLYIYAGEDLPEEDEGKKYTHKDKGEIAYVDLIRNEVSRLTDGGKDKDSLVDIEKAIGFPLSEMPSKTPSILKTVYSLLKEM